MIDINIECMKTAINFSKDKILSWLYAQKLNLQSEMSSERVYR